LIHCSPNFGRLPFSLYSLVLVPRFGLGLSVRRVFVLHTSGSCPVTPLPSQPTQVLVFYTAENRLPMAPGPSSEFLSPFFPLPFLHYWLQGYLSMSVTLLIVPDLTRTLPLRVFPLRVFTPLVVCLGFLFFKGHLTLTRFFYYVHVSFRAFLYYAQLFRLGSLLIQQTPLSSSLFDPASSWLSR